MNKLRDELLRITENGNPSSHPSLIEKLNEKIPHSIKVLESITNINLYTCILFVFNIVNDEKYLSLARMCPQNIYASTEFIQFLINRNYVIELHQQSINCLIIYFENGKIKHIGRLINNNLVISKWGIGHLYQHPIFEVPSSYGTKIKCYSNINRDEMMNYFVEYAKSKEIEFKYSDSEPLK